MHVCVCACVCMCACACVRVHVCVLSFFIIVSSLGLLLKGIVTKHTLSVILDKYRPMASQ